MAHDSYRGLPPDQSTPYPQYEYGQTQYPDPRNYQSLAPPYQTESVRDPSRASYSAHSPPDNYQTAHGQPIHDAVATVFDHSSAATQVPPEIIKQLAEEIKAEVLNTLQASGHIPPIRQQQASGQTSLATVAPPPSQPYVPQSPTSTETSKSIPSRPVHTPPSPTRRSSNGSSPPDPLSQDQHHIAVDSQREDLSGRYGDRSEDVSLRRTETNTLPTRQPVSDRSAEASDPSRKRPPPARRIMTNEEETVVEKMWQPLFDSEGQPTARLGQFLRGLALHLVCTKKTLPQVATTDFIFID